MEQRLIDIDYEPVFDETPAEPASAAPTPATPPPKPSPEPVEDRATRDRPEPEPTGYVIPKLTAQDLPQVGYESDKAPVKLQDIDYEPTFDEPAKPAAEKPNYISNIARGVGERGIQLIGGTAGTIADITEGVADWMDQNAGKPTW